VIGRRPFLLLPLAFASGGACENEPQFPSSTRSAAEARPAPPTPTKPTLHYHLRVVIDPEQHNLRVVAAIRSARPRSRFFLNPALAIESIEVGGKSVRCDRSGDAIDLAEPASRLDIRYQGVLTPELSPNDSKGKAYVEPGRVRLTEVTLWYPVFYDGPEAFPWPPEPVEARLELPAVDGLSWVTSGKAVTPVEFVVDEPGDLSVVGLPGAPLRVADPSGTVALTVLGVRGDALVERVVDVVRRHASRLGRLRDKSLSLVSFPDEAVTKPLGFLSSRLVVFNTPMSRRLAENGPEAVWTLAHELGHLWFGAELRASGPAALWLSEGFAEYFSWLVLRDLFGDDGYTTREQRARERSDGTRARLDALAAGDQRVYTIGALALHDLALRVGPGRLEAAIRDIHSARRPWTTDSFFAAIIAKGAAREDVAAFRSEWGA